MPHLAPEIMGPSMSPVNVGDVTDQPRVACGPRQLAELSVRLAVVAPAVCLDRPFPALPGPRLPAKLELS
jgi:hypothetical protein